MTTTLCHEFTDLKTPWGPIKLEQHGPDDFRVTYGLQVEDHLTYSDACAKLGQVQMHWLACAGSLDNGVEGAGEDDTSDGAWFDGENWNAY